MPEVTTDKKTVWINQAGCCIARFTSNLFEIHQHIHVGGRLLYARKGPLNYEDWDDFRARVLALHQIDIPENLAPQLSH